MNEFTRDHRQDHFLACLLEILHAIAMHSMIICREQTIVYTYFLFTFYTLNNQQLQTSEPSLAPLKLIELIFL